MKSDVSPLWTGAEMIEAMGGRLIGVDSVVVEGLSIDTRSLQAGDAYFAIKGDVHDGHKFVAAAHGAGAVVSVVAEDWLDRLEGETGPLLVVDEVLPALEKLGLASRARSKAKIVAVTGSVGKTTTKEALRTALAASGLVHASVASFNNHWGVPLTLARMPRETEFGVFEIGMNHPNEISPLVAMVRPHVAMITNVAAVHLGAFANVDEIAHAKAEIFDGLDENGTAVLNGDDARLPLLRELAQAKGVSKIETFGESAQCDVHLDKLILHGTCSCMTASVRGKDMVVKVGTPGRHIAQNILGVLAVVDLLGADLAQAGLALAHLTAVKGRGERHLLRVDDGEFVLIDESYNANPTSVRAALALLAATKPRGRGRHIAVLGDMLELGETSADLHGGLAADIVENGIDRVFLAGPEMETLRDALVGKVETTHAASISELLGPIESELRAGDVLMAKASLGMGFARLIDHLKSECPAQGQ